MESVPRIGDRVQVIPGHRYYPTTGMVERIYAKRVCLNDAELDDPDVDPVYGEYRPERDWHVVIRVDCVPPNWAYGVNPRFAPSVAEIEPAR